MNLVGIAYIHFAIIAGIISDIADIKKRTKQTKKQDK